MQPLARVVAYHVSGVDPTIMGIGPAPAIRGVLEKAGLSLDDISLVDVKTLSILRKVLILAAVFVD